MENIYQSPEDTSLSDDYDRDTVEECRRYEMLMDESEKKGDKPKPFMKMIRELTLYHKTGERYRNKQEAINRRKTAIAEYHNRLANAKLKLKILCLVCQTEMEVLDKVEHGFGKGSQILFHMGCFPCKQHRRFLENGEEYRPPKPTCSKCKTEVEQTSSREGNKFLFVYTCAECGHSETETLDLDSKLEPKIDENFLKDRDKYCLTKDKGQEYIPHVRGMEHFKEYLQKDLNDK